MACRSGAGRARQRDRDPVPAGKGQASHWHKVDAAEIWLWHAGSPLRLDMAADDLGPVESVRLGPDVLTGEVPQQVIPANAWQAAEADRGWTLVSCIVSPAFTFDGFTLAPDGWRPDALG